jgi:hypothetical protein
MTSTSCSFQHSTEIESMAAERDPKQNTASAVVDDDEPDDWYVRLLLDSLV